MEVILEPPVDNAIASDMCLFSAAPSGGLLHKSQVSMLGRPLYKGQRMLAHSQERSLPLSRCGERRVNF